MTAILSVYVTFPDKAVATEICRAVIEKRLAACANIIDGIKSIYLWDNAVQDASEVAAILKTPAEKWPDLMMEIKRRHPYQVPCIIAWPLEAGNPDYLDWVMLETSAQDKS